ncbi:DUF3231 family protein [Ammoniphilus sp. 3BR4]|uniref:DUF3231 family protein n=1 Tax=Ammoniphilus sp. 3BR4 TaxID=3158265 RepID=UPI0034671130
MNQNNLSNLFSQLIVEKKKTGISNAEIIDFLTQIMGTTTKKNTLTAAEVSTLWVQYLGDTLGTCVYKYFLEIVEDKQLQSILEFALQLAENHVTQITAFFKQANFQVPMGFTEHDVNLNAPRLFSDPLLAFYTEIMTCHGLNAYSLAIATSEREDIRNFFHECTVTASELISKTIKYSQSKGLFSGVPSIPSPEQVEFVESTGIMSNLFGDKRPLNASEINNLFTVVKKITLPRALTIAFSQVAETEDVRKFMFDISEVAGKNIDRLTTILVQEHLKSPRTWDNEVTNSTVSPFSDKLMMLHIAFLMNSAIIYYATGMASSLRPDVVLTYNENVNNVNKNAKGLYAILLKHGWLEKQPEAIDRKSLAQGEKK